MPCAYCDADVDGGCTSAAGSSHCLLAQLREAQANERQSTLVDHAENELAALPGRKTSARTMLERDVVALVALFEAQRHSGSSARFVTDALDQLLRWKSLDPSDSALQTAVDTESPCLPPDIADRDGSYYPPDLQGFDLLEWIVGYYGVNIPNGLGDKLYELAGEWRMATERLEDMTSSLRVELAAKQGAHNEIKILDGALRSAVRKLDEGHEIKPESQAHEDMRAALT